MARENDLKKVYLSKFRESKEAVKRIEDQITALELYEASPKTIDIEMHGSRARKDMSDYATKKMS